MQNVSVMGRVSVRGIIYSIQGDNIQTLLDLTSFFYSKILATLLPVIYCKNALKIKLTKKYNLLVLVHFYNTVASNLL